MRSADDGAAATGTANPQFSVLLSALRSRRRRISLLPDAGPVTPVVVYTGPTRNPAQLATLATEAAAEPAKKKVKHKPAEAKSAETKTAAVKPTDSKVDSGKTVTGKTTDGKTTDGKTTDGKTVTGKTADGKTKTGKPSSGAAPWTPMSSSTLAASPPPGLKS